MCLVGNRWCWCKYKHPRVDCVSWLIQILQCYEAWLFSKCFSHSILSTFFPPNKCVNHKWIGQITSGLPNNKLTSPYKYVINMDYEPLSEFNVKGLCCLCIHFLQFQIIRPLGIQFEWEETQHNVKHNHCHCHLTLYTTLQLTFLHSPQP